MVYAQSPYGEAAYGEDAAAVVTTAIPLATARAVGLDPAASGDTISVRQSLAVAIARGYSPGVANEAIVATSLGRAVAVGLTPILSGVTLMIPLARAKAAALTPTVVQVISGGTDSSNALDGRSRGGLATGSVTTPVEPVPPGLTLGEKVDKAIAYPDPVMVNGRPT